MNAPEEEFGSTKRLDGNIPEQTDTKKIYVPDETRGELKSELFRALADSAPQLEATRIPELITSLDTFRYGQRRKKFDALSATGETILDILTRAWRDVLHSTGRYEHVSAPVLDAQHRKNANTRLKKIMMQPNRCTIDDIHATFFTRNDKRTKITGEFENLLLAGTNDNPHFTFLDVTLSRDNRIRNLKQENMMRFPNLFYEHYQSRVQGVTVIIANEHKYDEVKQTIWYAVSEVICDICAVLEKTNNYRIGGASCS